MPVELTDFPVSIYETTLVPPFGKKIVFLSGYAQTTDIHPYGIGGGSHEMEDWTRIDIEFVIGPKWSTINPKDIAPRVSPSTIWQYPMMPTEVYGWGVDNCRADIKDDKIRLTCTLSAVSNCTACEPTSNVLDQLYTWAGIIRLNYNVTAVGSFGEGEGEGPAFWPPISERRGPENPDLNPQLLCFTKLTNQDTPVTASGNDANYLPSLALDNDSGSRWAVDGVGSWIKLDLGSQKKACKVQVMWYKGSEGRKYNFVIEKSTDNNIFSPVYMATSNGYSAIDTYAFSTTDARYIRITVNGNNENTYASIRELAVLGTGV